MDYASLTHRFQTHADRRPMFHRHNRDKPESAARHVSNCAGTDRKRPGNRDEFHLQIRWTTNPLATFLMRHLIDLVAVVKTGLGDYHGCLKFGTDKWNISL